MITSRNKMFFFSVKTLRFFFLLISIMFSFWFAKRRKKKMFFFSLNFIDIQFLITNWAERSCQGYKRTSNILDTTKNWLKHAICLLRIHWYIQLHFYLHSQHSDSSSGRNVMAYYKAQIKYGIRHENVAVGIVIFIGHLEYVLSWEIMYNNELRNYI